MESQSAARSRATGAIRNRLLFVRKAQLRDRRYCAWRISSDSRSVTGSATEATLLGDEHVARDNSGVGQALAFLIYLFASGALANNCFDPESNLNPHTPSNFAVLHPDHVGFSWHILFSRSGYNEGARSAQQEAEQNDRDLRQ